MIITRRVLLAFATAILPVLAYPEPATVPATFAAIHGLLKRQSSVAPPVFPIDSLPSQCQSICTTTNSKISSCTNDKCFCTDANLNSFGSCLNCLATAAGTPGVFDATTAQNSINQLTDICNKEGFKVKPVTIGTSDSDSNGSTGPPSSANNSAMHSGLLGTGALAVIVMSVAFAA